MASKRRRQWSGVACVLGDEESKQQSSIREYFSKAPGVNNMTTNGSRSRPAVSQSAMKLAPVAASSIKTPSHTTTEHRATTVTPSSVAKQPNSQEESQATCTNSTINKLKPPSNNNNNNINNKNTTTNNNNKQRKFQQLYLDLGQRNFGKQTVCDICGMLFVHGVEEDAKEHERICKEIREGVAFQFQRKACRVVVDFAGNASTGAAKAATVPNDSGYIVEVRPSDSHALRQKASAVTAIVDKELGFAQASALALSNASTGHKKQAGSTNGRPAPTVFLYIRQKKVVGMVSAEVTRQAYRLLSVENKNYDTDDKEQRHHRRNYPQHERSTQTYRSMIGIHKLWVHSKVRNQSIATRLVSSARARMVFGTVVPANLVAFSSPTEAGARFAQTYVHNETGSQDIPVLVYDLPIT